MKADGELIVVGIARSRSQLLDYLELMKPELTGLSVLTALCGFHLGSVGPLNLPLFISVAIGTLLVGGGAGALNQLIERDYDAMMRRTERRPLPAGRLKTSAVFSFGIAASVVGVVLLTIAANILTGFLAVLTITTYLFLYTPLKRLTPFSTWVGGIPGALPPMMGWTAIRNEISLPAIVLFAILFFWQIPHFHSLAWMYRKDYARAGFRFLSVEDVSGSRTSGQILLSCLALIPASLALTLIGSTGSIYFGAAVVAGVSFLLFGIVFARASASGAGERAFRTNVLARRMFSASLAYLPILMVFASIDKL
jgi:protoheme IX farnesyltransferase